MKLIDDLFKDKELRWKSEKIWTNFALMAFHSMAAYQAVTGEGDMDLKDWVQAYIMLHTALFVTNGVKTFLEKKSSTTVAIDSEETNVSTAK